MPWLTAPSFWQTPNIISDLLSPLGYLYAGATAWNLKHAVPYRPPVPVICVGNVSLGGTGKTPITMDLTQRLQAMGQKPHILLRGYGSQQTRQKDRILQVDPVRHSAAEVGDEALLLAQIAPTWIGQRRDYSAAAAYAAGATCLLMDDGLQNPYIAKDFSLIVVDRGTGLGNGLPFPAGPLREPFSIAAKRAQAVVVMGDPTQIMPALPAHALPVLTAHLQLDTTVVAKLQGQPLYAFAGIGQPAKFFRALKAADLNLKAARAFPDHFAYQEIHLIGLLAQAQKSGAQLITTEKDAARIPAQWHAQIITMPAQVVWNEPVILDNLLSRYINR